MIAKAALAAIETATKEGLKSTKKLREVAPETGPLASRDISGDVKRLRDSADTRLRDGIAEAEPFSEICDDAGVVLAKVSPDEFSHYIETCGLQYERVGDKDSLIRSDIDWEKVSENADGTTVTNRELAKSGQAPLDGSGRPYELHHIGQKNDGPLAELTSQEHRSSDYYKLLHSYTATSEIDRVEFRSVKERYWQIRAEEVNA